MKEQIGAIDVPKISRAGLAACKRQLDDAELALAARQASLEVAREKLRTCWQV